MANLLTERFGGRRVLIPSIQFNRQQSETLIDIVMKLSANPGALFFVGFDQPAAYGGHGFFGELSFGDVDARPDVAREGAIRVEPRYALVQNPAVLPIMSPEPILHLKRLSSVECFRVGLQAGVNIVRMKASGPTIAELFFQRAAGEVQPGLVDVAAFSVGPGCPDHYRCGVRDQPE